MQTILYAYPASLTRGTDGRYLVRFPDLPEALTDGATEDMALKEAADCLSEALAARIIDGEAIPTPSPVRRNQFQVAPDATIALKAALHTILADRRFSAAELARRLGIDHKEARRILDPRHPTKLPRLAAALEALGHDMAVTVHDASRRERLLSSPVDVRPKRMKVARAIAVKEA